MTLLRTARFSPASHLLALARRGRRIDARRARFFDVGERLRRLSDLGDQLLPFSKVVDFEIFRPELSQALADSGGVQGGRPPFDPVMMFKILLIQAADTLSEERAEFLINAVSGLGAVRPGSRRARRSGCSGIS
jgi:hypothetical protein